MTPLRDERVVFDRDRVTAAGVTAGIDLGLELVRRYRGDFRARTLQLLDQYDPRPPFPGAGDPATAQADVVERPRRMTATAQAAADELLREAFGRSKSARLVRRAAPQADISPATTA